MTNQETATNFVNNLNNAMGEYVKVDCFDFLDMIKGILKEKGVKHSDRMEILDLVFQQMKEQDRFL